MGKVRENYGIASFDYGRDFAKGLYRRGINNNLTAEGYAEATRTNRVMGAGLTATLGTLAVANLSVAASAGDAQGTSTSASIERSAKYFSFGLRGQRVSGGFRQLGELPDLQHRFSANAGVSLGNFGSASLVHAAEKKLERGSIRSDAISYQKQLGRQLAVLASFSVIHTETGSHRFAGLALAMPLNSSTSASVSASRQDRQGEYLLDARESLPADEGWARRVRIDTTRNGEN